MKFMRNVLCLLLVLVFCVGCGASPGTSPATPSGAEARYALCTAAYPAYPAYVDAADFYTKNGSFDEAGYEKAMARQAADYAALGITPLSEEQTAGVLRFAARTVPVICPGEENVVYSPVNLYLALAMLTEMADGDTQTQLLGLLEAGETNALRESAQQIWKNTYVSDGKTVCTPANSVWLNQQMSFHKETLQILADSYYASSYQVAMGTAEADSAIADWVNGQTGGLLNAQIRTDALQLLAIYSALYFKAAWQDTFSTSRTASEIFHASDGKEETCDFMHMSCPGSYRKGENYTAAIRYLKNSHDRITFILPDKGTSLREVLASPTLFTELSPTHSAEITWSMPKFDVSSKLDLIGSLKSLGVTDAFDENAADFSRITDQEAVVDRISHVARMKVDEEGMEAAAYTEISMKTTAALAEEQVKVEMHLNRPFLVIVNSSDGLPLFLTAVCSVT